MTLKKLSRTTKTLLVGLMLSGLGFILTQAAGQSLASQLPARFFEEYGAVMLVIEPSSGRIREANRAAANFYGYSIQQLQRMSIQDINALDPADVALERELARRENRNYFVFPHRLANGEIRTVEVYSWPLVTDDGETLLFSVILDITGKKIAEASVLEYKDRLERLAESRYQQLLTTQKLINRIMWATLLIQLVVITLLIWNILIRRKTQRSLLEKTTMLEGLLNSIPDLIFFKNKAGVYLGCNAQFARYVGKKPQDITGQTDYQLFDNRQAGYFHKTDLQVLAGQQQVHTEEWTQFPDGSERLLDKIKAPLVSSNNELIGVLGVSRDITERYQTEQRIKFLAYFDPLTNLPNRYLFQERFVETCNSLVRGQALAALAILDLDHFKNINDALGHNKGDELLVAIARRLNNLLRDNEALARFGGDEFVLLLVEQGGDADSCATLMDARIQQFQNTLAQPLRLGESEFLLGSSLGASFTTSFDRSFDELLKEADIALYAAKEAGRSTWRRFVPSMQARVESRFELEGELRKALDLQQLRLYLQPKTNREGQVYGTESLVRWEHPEKGLIPPDRFIPLAEDTGMILPLGEWVLKETLQLMTEYPQLSFAVNISPRQFRNPDFVARIKTLIQETGANPQRLTLEVTEGLLITDFNQSSRRMLELQQLGISFSIDDFGTGYSSLSYLKKLPINELKIDRSFVKDLPEDSSDALLVETMMAVAKHLQLSVVAEGVETQAQRDYLYSVDCNLHQGYFYGKPEPARQLLERLKP
ncbi:sensor domain-containing protein [Marinospirillum alkaliphilum]|uniref:PAS domain S-box-containing protein/diguanylate cyclase (GGDEF) domain-containing protein n=1 Tax=Marinospirillum alkaliphilum DSM 21637 TaxID=1122209 RepID=A0A1K1Y4F0_9GAMM|nr:EAL domain-containing protein [Marinospirillum alkaliphilum]SFX56197.1 PAS domain S-box-containing protein/diguanylate cyclase (GGDEF) domain-containing protein [Marinospirillum alkaliphilum DSM 21637]